MADPHPRPVVDREAVAQAVAGHTRSEMYRGSAAEWWCPCGDWRTTDINEAVYGHARHVADLVLALLPTGEGAKAKCKCAYPDDAHCPIHGDQAGEQKRLIEVATHLGYELGRKEALTEVVDRLTSDGTFNLGDVQRLLRGHQDAEKGAGHDQAGT